MMLEPANTDRTAAERYHANRQRSLARKFRCAFRGLKRGLRRESNFFVHFFVAAAVVAAAAVLHVSLIEWSLLGIAIAGVLAAEMFNTSIEMLAKAVTDDYDSDIEDALDTASASVLIAAAGATAIGAMVFLPRLAAIVGWW